MPHCRDSSSTVWAVARTPTQWKVALTVLFYKKDDPYDVKNYRPIGLLNTVYKFWTLIITDCMNRCSLWRNAAFLPVHKRGSSRRRTRRGNPKDSSWQWRTRSEAYRLPAVCIVCRLRESDIGVTWPNDAVVPAPLAGDNMHEIPLSANNKRMREAGGTYTHL